MQIIKKDIRENHEIVYMGDLHDGSLLSSKKGFEVAVNFIKKKKNRYVVLMGDLMDGISIKDKRYDPKTTLTLPLRQMENIYNLLKPIRSRIVCSLSGNHEDTISKNEGDVMEIICERLKIPYATRTAKIIFGGDKGTYYKSFITHGSGTLSSKAVDPIQNLAALHIGLKKKLCKKAGDCSIMVTGHNHKALTVAPSANELYLIDDGEELIHKYLTPEPATDGYITESQRWYVSSGSFLKLYEIGVSGYADASGYDPLALAFVNSIVKKGKIVKVYPILL